KRARMLDARRGIAGQSSARMRRRLLLYGFAILWVALAALARVALEPALGDTSPHFTFILAVTLTAWQAGSGPALLATALGFVAASWFVLASAQPTFLTAPTHFAAGARVV